MQREITVTRCINACPFYTRIQNEGMFCEHPVYETNPYAGAIITNENGTNRVPDNCPLRKEGVTTVVHLGQ